MFKLWIARLAPAVMSSLLVHQVHAKRAAAEQQHACRAVKLKQQDPTVDVATSTVSNMSLTATERMIASQRTYFWMMTVQEIVNTEKPSLPCREFREPKLSIAYSAQLSTNVPRELLIHVLCSFKTI
jgi:hypothetical protein